MYTVGQETVYRTRTRTAFSKYCQLLIMARGGFTQSQGRRESLFPHDGTFHAEAEGPE